jgi:hypothetical protein
VQLVGLERRHLMSFGGASSNRITSQSVEAFSIGRPHGLTRLTRHASRTTSIIPSEPLSRFAASVTPAYGFSCAWLLYPQHIYSLPAHNLEPHELAASAGLDQRHDFLHAVAAVHRSTFTSRPAGDCFYNIYDGFCDICIPSSYGPLPSRLHLHFPHAFIHTYIGIPGRLPPEP